MMMMMTMMMMMVVVVVGGGGGGPPLSREKITWCPWAAPEYFAKARRLQLADASFREFRRSGLGSPYDTCGNFFSNRLKRIRSPWLFLATYEDVFLDPCAVLANHF